MRHTEIGIPLRTFPTEQQENLLACAPHYPFNVERQAGKDVSWCRKEGV